jgi:hypothetical protein
VRNVEVVYSDVILVLRGVSLEVGHSDAERVRLQNRAGLGVGIPIDARQRIDVGYMNQWNRITPRETHEINHTLVIGWVWTAGR